MAGEEGVFREDLVEDRGDRRRGVAKPGETGIRAVTEWKVVERFGIATLVEARLKTGRTHQIRVHFANAGHPLVGDPVYRDAKLPPFPIPFARQALHAGHLGWQKADGERVSVEAPPPADFQQLLTALRAFKGKRIVAAPPPRPAAAPKPLSRPAAVPRPPSGRVPRETPGEASRDARGGTRKRPPAPGPKSESGAPPKPGTLGGPGKPFRRPGSRPGFRPPTRRPKP